MNALILAGGEVPPELSATIASPASNSSNIKYRALIDLHGRPIVSYVMEALSATRGLNRIAVAGSEAVQECVRQIRPDVIAVPDTGKMTGNTVAGLKAISEATGSSERVLITTCDIPLVSSKTFEELLTGTEQRNLDAAYAIVSREVCQAAFPTGRRTYARLADGTFTAGNAMIIQPHAVEPLVGLFEKFYQARKNPLAMARMLGSAFLWKALTRRLTVAEGEATFSKLLNCRAGTVTMQDATIAFDVDKMDDYEVALKALQPH